MSAAAANRHFESDVYLQQDEDLLAAVICFSSPSCSTPLALPCRCQGGQQQHCQNMFPSLCISEFQKSQSAMDALEAINGWTMKGSELRSRNALAPGHLWRWIWQMNHSKGKQGKHIFYEKMEQLSDSVSVRLC